MENVQCWLGILNAPSIFHEDTRHTFCHQLEAAQNLMEATACSQRRKSLGTFAEVQFQGQVFLVPPAALALFYTCLILSNPSAFGPLRMKNPRITQLIDLAYLLGVLLCTEEWMTFRSWPAERWAVNDQHYPQTIGRNKLLVQTAYVNGNGKS